MITPEQIHAALGYSPIMWDQDNSWNFVGYGIVNDTFPVPGIGSAHIVKSQNNDEGWHSENVGENFIVFELNGQYFKKCGFYGDWNGDLVEVEPYEKTVIDYREKNV